MNFNYWKFETIAMIKTVNLEKLAVVHKSQKSGWIHSGAFEDCFFNFFLTEVENTRKAIGENNEVFLLVNNSVTK